jgi:hypothetical protein
VWCAVSHSPPSAKTRSIVHASADLTETTKKHLLKRDFISVRSAESQKRKKGCMVIASYAIHARWLKKMRKSQFQSRRLANGVEQFLKQPGMTKNIAVRAVLFR